jgi:hypothetical protein
MFPLRRRPLHGPLRKGRKGNSRQKEKEEKRRTEAQEEKGKVNGARQAARGTKGPQADQR